VKASSTSPSSDAGELDRLEEEIKLDQPEPTPAPGPEQSAPGPSDDDRAGALIDHIGEHPELLQDLTDEDVAEFCEMVFGIVAEGRGKHWEMPATSPEAKRIGKWMSKAVQRHGWAWIGKWLPDILSLALLLNAVTRRAKLDKKPDLHPTPGSSNG